MNSYFPELHKKIQVLKAQIRTKRTVIKKLLKKEATLDKKIGFNLKKIIETENKFLLIARKGKDQAQTSLSKKVQSLKKRQQDYQKRTHLIEKMRLQQENLQKKISDLQKFISKHKPPLTKPLKKTKKAPIRKAKKRIHPPIKAKRLVKTKTKKKIKKTEKKARQAKPVKPKKPKPYKPIKPKPVKPKKVLPVKSKGPLPKIPFFEREPITPVQEEKPIEEIEKTPESSFEEKEVEKPLEETDIKVPSFEEKEEDQDTLESEMDEKEEDESAFEPEMEESKEEWKPYSQNGIIFEHPPWMPATQKKADALFAIEKEGIKLELFEFGIDVSTGLNENAHAQIEKEPSATISNEENINEYLFITYITPENNIATKHYVLFAQKNNQLVKLEASGNPILLDQHSTLIVKVFRSLHLE
ncbi:hypothetical protein KKE06_04125 [Candidatus Micrarchaeota archaeon]|nr:hypothetical protein [Candidatus Micrarchaeota archaeon]MBU1930692.1 hypothetical protein [Candidatus Micrarchaeota archaeon]